MKVQIEMDDDDFLTDEELREDIEDILHSAGYTVYDVSFINEY